MTKANETKWGKPVATTTKVTRGSRAAWHGPGAKGYPGFYEKVTITIRESDGKFAFECGRPGGLSAKSHYIYTNRRQACRVAEQIADALLAVDAKDAKGAEFIFTTPNTGASS